MILGFRTTRLNLSIKDDTCVRVLMMMDVLRFSFSLTSVSIALPATFCLSRRMELSGGIKLTFLAITQRLLLTATTEKAAGFRVLVKLKSLAKHPHVRLVDCECLK